MTSNFRTVAWLVTKQVPVAVVYDEADGKPIVYGVFHGDKDVTWDMNKDEYALIYQKVGAHIIESMTEAGELAKES